MRISGYQKRFGVGLACLGIGAAVLFLLWGLDRALGHVEIAGNPKPVRIAGFAVVALWLCWQFWCMKTIRRWWNHGQLCTTGPYRFVRHPIYAGGIFPASAGLALILNSWILFLLPGFLYPVFSFLVRKEEILMTRVFGEEYTLYAARTGKLFPRILPKK